MTGTLKVYLAGPMRGKPNWNFAAFDVAAHKLRNQGYEVFSPAEKGCEVDLLTQPTLQENLAFRRKVFALDMAYIANEADVVALLPGWEQSAGARAERALAEAIGLSVILLGMEYGV